MRNVIDEIYLYLNLIESKQQLIHILLSYPRYLYNFRKLLIYGVDGTIVLYKALLINLSKLLIYITGLSWAREKLLS